MLIKRFVFIFFIFLTAKSFSQDGILLVFTDSSRYEVGLSDSYFSRLTYKPIKKLNIEFSNSFFVEKFKYQYFSLKLGYKIVDKSGLSLYAYVKGFSNFSLSTKDIYFTPVLNYSYKNLLFSASLNTIYTDKLELYEKIELAYKVFNDIYLLGEYGTSYFSYKNEKVISLGLIFRKKGLHAVPKFQIPTDFNEKHLNLLVSFSYQFGKVNK